MSKYILKLARCIQELERIKGVQTGKGGDRGNQYTKANDKLSIAKNQWTKCPLYKIHK